MSRRIFTKSTVYKYVYKATKALKDDNNLWIANVRINKGNLYYYKSFETEEQAGRAVDFFMVSNNRKPVNGFKIVKKQ